MFINILSRPNLCNYINYYYFVDCFIRLQADRRTKNGKKCFNRIHLVCVHRHTICSLYYTQYTISYQSHDVTLGHYFVERNPALEWCCLNLRSGLNSLDNDIRTVED